MKAVMMRAVAREERALPGTLHRPSAAKGKAPAARRRKG